jgi:hypothetical protein
MKKVVQAEEVYKTKKYRKSKMNSFFIMKDCEEKLVLIFEREFKI